MNPIRNESNVIVFKYNSFPVNNSINLYISTSNGAKIVRIASSTKEPKIINIKLETAYINLFIGKENFPWIPSMDVDAIIWIIKVINIITPPINNAPDPSFEEEPFIFKNIKANTILNTAVEETMTNPIRAVVFKSK